MSEATQQEKDLVSIFRGRIKDLPIDEEQLHEQHMLRWIRAREGDLAKAEDMFRRHMEWRKTNGIGPSLLDWIPSVYLTDTYSAKFCGYDTSGSPIVLFTFGLWDLRPALARGEKENVRRYKDQSLERTMKLMKLYENQRQYHKNMLSNFPEKVTQFNCICDWTGFSLRYIMSKEVVEIILEAARSFEANYPETLKAAYNINCPKVFDVLFKLVKPFLSERTLSKIFIYDSNEAKWKHDMLKTLPADQIPVRYGGTREIMWELADLNFDLQQDGSFFEEIFENSPRRNDDQEIEEKEGFKKVLVESFDKVSIPLVIVSPRTIMKWKVKVDKPSGEIDFSIHCDNVKRNERETCIEKKNVKQDSGNMNCERAGSYWVTFSNSGIEMDDIKTVWYKLSLDVPE
ncbi:unnamed protein product [Orchesella dallaii]|uniref:CRAL-TRIO domain-containing protein n=1 Tax=Orchesella dallaii TaxID=48710 RepID=A0ABP1PJZ4_9HEXA